MEEIGAGITLLISLTRADIVGIRRAVNLDELIGKGALLLGDGSSLSGERLVLPPQELRGVLGTDERGGRVLQRTYCASVDLLVVRLAGVDLRGRDVEGERAAAQAERVQAAIGVVEGVLHCGRLSHDLRQLGHGRAVDFLDALMRRIRIDGGQQRIRRDPVQIRPLPGAARPVIRAPAAHLAGGGIGAAIAQVTPATGLGGGESLAIGKVERLAGGAGERGGGTGKFPFVEVIDLHRHAADEHSFGARHPREVRIAQQPIVSSQRGKIVTVGIAVTLREELRGVRHPHVAVGVHVADVVVERVDGFAGENAAGVIPDEAIVERRDAAAGLEEVVASAQQAEFFIHQRG